LLYRLAKENDMKTQTISRATLILLATSATLLFTGCSGETSGPISANVDTKSYVSNNTNMNTNSPANVDAESYVSNADASDTNDNTEAPVQDVEASRVSEAQITEYLDAINAARAETQDCGSEGVFDPAPALRWNNRLANTAYEHSHDMAESNTFSHTGSGTASDETAQDSDLGRGSKFGERIEHQGYTSYKTIGENIAAGYATAQEAVDAWIESDHHCANLMSPDYNEVGMALVEKTGSDYGFYWSQEFGNQ
jgi:uncharacterized protein YkwD